MIGGSAEYDVGDIVRIVDKPYRECVFSWVGSMDKYCSRTAKITGTHGTWKGETAYTIDIDDGEHSWCAHCFMPKAGPDFEQADDSELMTLFGM